MAHPASCFVLVGSADHDLRAFVRCRPAVDQPLIARCRSATQDAYRIQFVDGLRDGHQLRHRAKGLAAEICVCASDYHATPRFRKCRNELHDTSIQELSFIDADYLRGWIEPLRDLRRRVDGNCLDRPPIVARDRIDARVSLVQSGFEDLYALAGDQSAPYPANQFLALPAEHDASDYFDPAAGVLVSDTHGDLPFEGSRTTRRSTGPSTGSSTAIVAM